MAALVATVGGYVCCVVLLMSGLLHARHVGELEAALRRQRLVPTGLIRACAVGVVTLESVLGAVGMLALSVLQTEAVTRAVLVVAGALFAGYAVYTAYLVSQGRRVPCGCSAADYPVNTAVVARAAGLSVAAFAAAAVAGDALTLGGGEEFVTAAIAAIGLSAIVWALPAALHAPSAPQPPAPTLNVVVTEGL